MLNPKTNQRELAYIVTIDEIRPIPNYDRVEHARVGGWWIIVKKDEFKVGDLAIYIEVDSKVPEKEPFMFLEKKHFKVKTIKMCKVLSQGLLIHPKEFGWTVVKFEVDDDETDTYINTANGILHVGTFLTKELGITYATEEDNKRKAPSVDKYKKMAQRRPDIFKKPWVRWMMKREWGKKVMFFFYGKAKDKKSGWPAWVKKTDEERVQNMTWILEDKTPWYATEKIDGTSTTFTMKGYGRKREFYVCSRNVVFDKPDKNCYYDTNVYTEMAEKYNMEWVLEALMEYFDNVTGQDIDFVTVQGETYGAGIQKRDYGLTDHDFMAFNVIVGFSNGTVQRLNPVEMTDVLTTFDVPCVPIVDKHFVLPDTVEELLNIATDKSAIDGEMREGLVFRSEDGAQSFKAVSNEFLLKYHS